ncbi:MAG: phytanoyl-CoA dioxygenase family protein [Chitinophagales bacterium]|nr:phytanoyl-CoA dioxygenase family protein [Chitinophagales bacterium]
MRQIFFNKDLDILFKENGYVVIPQLVEFECRNKILSYFKKCNIEKSNTIQLTGSIKDFSLKSNIHAYISSTIAPLTQEILINYEPVQGIFSNKPPHPDSTMCIHRDWNLVDEAQFTSLSVWTLIDGDSNQHGHLDVWPKSHLEHYSVRGRNFDFEILPEKFEHSRKTIYLKAGDAIIFDHRLVHASGANLSDTDRLAAVLAFLPKEAPLLHYYKDMAHHELKVLELEKSQFHLLDFTLSDLPPYKQIVKTTILPYEK